MNGWCRIKKAAAYAGVSIRTLRDWLNIGLKHSRIGQRIIVIRFADIDDFLEAHSVNGSEANYVKRIVDETLKDFNMK